MYLIEIKWTVLQQGFYIMYQITFWRSLNMMVYLYVSLSLLLAVLTGLTLSLAVLQEGSKERDPKSTRVYPKVSGLAAWSENCKW
jgi:hypothetical protein